MIKLISVKDDVIENVNLLCLDPDGEAIVGKIYRDDIYSITGYAAKDKNGYILFDVLYWAFVPKVPEV